MGKEVQLGSNRKGMDKKPKLNRYIVRKYIMAKSAVDAIKKDKIAPVNDVWLDDDWKKQQTLDTAIGFALEKAS